MTAGSSLAIVALIASVAAADPADDAFKKGRELLKAGKYAEACVQFERSDDLDPQLGTRFNIALCNEKQGKLATALAIYRTLAQQDTNAARRTNELEREADLDRRTPKLWVELVDPPRGITVMAGDVPIAPNAPAQVDVGTYKITVRAPGFREVTTIVKAVESHTTTIPVTLNALPAGSPEPTKPTAARPVAPKADAPKSVVAKPEVAKPERAKPEVAKPEAAKPEVAKLEPVKPKPREPDATTTTHTDAEPPGSIRRSYATYAFAAGGTSVAVGLVLGVLARSKWNDAKAACGGTQTCATADELARANQLADAAQSRATWSTGLVGVGVAFAAVGTMLWVTAPSEHAVVVTPTAGPDHAAVWLSGRF